MNKRWLSDEALVVLVTIGAPLLLAVLMVLLWQLMFVVWRLL